ncbi:uncharacterized protein LOC111570912 isoform X2 [Amphiprion ocellaris]|uniref:uncharacterized protein LOC111570912 isoform X2 n=1 Tax=Amphiprion ocellaris TaxID=80972 RepID=UPI0024113E84|nr:uncharacterized protein LOC111570912 isoform X2 [Amphiprion ocellaris]
MKLGEKKTVLLVSTESIEMELFSSDCCEETTTHEKEEEHNFDQRYLEHPLVPDCEEDPEPQVQSQPTEQTRPKTRISVHENNTQHPPVMDITQQMEIEMEVFPPRVSNDPSIMSLSPNRASRLKWKRLIPQKKGLVVKDVVCLPRAYNTSQPDRHTVPHGKQRAALAAMGLITRITIDDSWSAGQMESRLVMLFWGRFVKQAGQRFSFTYLQCLQGSRALFVPDTPAEGWTGDHVLRISGHGALYILSHHGYPQAESERSASETAVVNRNRFYLEVGTESCQDDGRDLVKQIQPSVRRTPKEVMLDVDTILKKFRQKNMHRAGEAHTQLRRRDVLHGALKEVRRPDFCFRTTPVISFSGEETTSRQQPLKECFRLALLKLQQSCVFEGRPGRLFFTCDLKALKDRKYYEAGVLIGWSLAQGGPGPRCLHPVLYQLMCCQSPSMEDFSWKDIADAEAQIRLQELQNCTDVKRLSPSLCDWVSRYGIPEIYSTHSDGIPAIYSRLVKHYIYHRVSSMISQFTGGLNSCGGLWDTVQSHWEAFVPVMTSTQQQHLILEDFKQLFTFCYSHPHSDLRAAEEATAAHWETVLTLVSDGQAEFSFEDLLTFITGGDQLPAHGFPTLIFLRFYSQGASMSNIRLPHAFPSSLEVFLPRGVSAAADLLALLNRAVLHISRQKELMTARK